MPAKNSALGGIVPGYVGSTILRDVGVFGITGRNSDFGEGLYLP